MRSRSLLFIVVIGIVAMAALGFGTKMAFDRSSSLRDIAEFKVRFLQAFAARGVKEIAYRSLRGRVALDITLPADAVIDEELHTRVGELFVADFPRRSGTLELRYLEPPGWFGSPREIAKREFVLADLRQDVRERERLFSARRALESAGGLALQSAKVDGQDIALVLSTSERLSPEALAAKVQDAIRHLKDSYRISPRGRYRAVVEWVEEDRVPAGAEPSPGIAWAASPPRRLAEGVYDSSAREVSFERVTPRSDSGAPPRSDSGAPPSGEAEPSGEIRKTGSLESPATR